MPANFLRPWYGLAHANSLIYTVADIIPQNPDFVKKKLHP